MSPKTDAIKEKLKKILAHVNHNANEFERDTAMQRLQEMLVKHRLEMKDIETKEEKKDLVRLSVVGRNGPWARQVAQYIAKLSFCNYYFTRSKSSDQRFVTHVFIGQQHEAEAAKELAMLIIEQLNTESGVQARRSDDPSFQRSFLNGAAYAIYLRVEELIKKASEPNETQSASTALMVLDAYKQALVETGKFLEETGVKITIKKTKSRTKSYAGLTQGRAFGEKIPLTLTKKLA